MGSGQSPRVPRGAPVQTKSSSAAPGPRTSLQVISEKSTLSFEQSFLGHLRAWNAGQASFEVDQGWPLSRAGDMVPGWRAWGTRACWSSSVPTTRLQSCLTARGWCPSWAAHTELGTAGGMRRGEVLGGRGRDLSPHTGEHTGRGLQGYLEGTAASLSMILECGGPKSKEP